MKITEAKLRKMIRGVIREFVTSASSTGAKKSGYESDDTKTALANVASALQSRRLTPAEPKTTSGVSKVYKKSNRRGGTDYSDSKASDEWTKNPDYTAWEDSEKVKADAVSQALSDLNQAKEADLRKIKTGEIPADVAGGGKGTKKKKKDDEE